MKRLQYKLLTLVTLIVLLFSTNTVWAAPTIPPRPQTDIYVSDQAGMLTPETRQAILSLGAQLEQKTTAQVALVTVPTLEGSTSEDYAVELFRAWGIGQKDKNNGVLFLISRDDRKLRIEVGYGLEGRLPDAKTGRILDNEVIPYFKKGDYNSGAYRGYAVIASEVANEYNVQLDTGQVQQIPRSLQDQSSTGQPVHVPFWVPLLIVGMLALDLIFNRGRIVRTIMEIIFWFMLFGGGRGGGRGGFGGGGGFGDGGGFGGGSSGGGGSSRDW